MAKNGIITLKSSKKNGKSVTRAKVREAVNYANSVQEKVPATPKVKVTIRPTKAA